MVGGIVIETLVVPALVENDVECAAFGKERAARVWVNVRDTRGRETCAIYVEHTNESRSISIGDRVWWQGGFAFWTPRHLAFHDKPLRRLGCSGVTRPRLTKEPPQ